MFAVKFSARVRPRRLLFIGAFLAVFSSPPVALAAQAATAKAEEPPVIRNCGDVNGDGRLLANDALAVLQTAVGLNPEQCQRICCDVSGGIDGVRAADALLVLQAAVGFRAPESLRCPSAARLWMEELLDAIRKDTPRPTVHARNLFHLSIAFWDTWVAYDFETEALPYLASESLTAPENVYHARSVAISYAAYRILRERFKNSPGKVASYASFDAAMDELGFDSSLDTTSGDSPVAVGNRVAAAVLAYGSTDGANEANDYEDDTAYAPVNDPLFPALTGTSMVDPNRWQPLSLDFRVTQNGIPVAESLQTFISPNWDPVAPFALVRGEVGKPYVDPGEPPMLGGVGDEQFKAAALEVVRYSSWLDPDDGQTMDASPASRGNSTLGTNDGTGYPTNPVTGQPYQPKVVLRADWGRVLAEFWADGPHSETPPGHWNTIANYVADHPAFEKRFGGAGDLVDALQWDVKLYLALNGAVHDAAVAAWGAKAIYDYSRPISMIRYMAGKGQSSNPAAQSYHPEGIPLEAGLVELITPQSAAPGGRHSHLNRSLREVAVKAWLGNPDDPESEHSGVGWILGEDWVPYQRDTFVTPAFAAYVSGHSTFSRAAAEVLTRITGTPYFPNGLGEFRAPKDTFLEFELGPSDDVTLQWATYQDAADEAGLSRLYGGVHVVADDSNGRIMGYQIGQDAYDLAEAYWNGTQTTP